MVLSATVWGPFPIQIMVLSAIAWGPHLVKIKVKDPTPLDAILDVKHDSIQVQLL